MHIRGTHTEEINVEISAYELFKALAEALGIEEYYKTHYVLEKENNEFILRRYEDTSYHGFSSYECVDECKDKDIVTRYMKLMEIEALYKEGKYKKEKEKNNGKGREIKEPDRQRTL